jgi:hypothetical protein
MLGIGCLLLAEHAAARTGPGTGSQETAAAQPKQTSRDPYVDTPAYQVFPWTFKAKHAFIFIVNPISTTPTPAAAYAGYTEKLSMLPGPQTGLIVAFKYSDSAIGEYSEILYRCAAGIGTSHLRQASPAAAVSSSKAPQHSMRPLAGQWYCSRQTQQHVQLLYY